MERQILQRRHEIQHEQLKRVAIMNLKKKAGTSRANYKELKEAARRDRVKILEEIKICAPKLIVACSHDVFNILCTVVFDINKLEYCNKICFTERMHGYGLYCDISKIIGADSHVYLLEYRHPSQCGRQGTREEHYKNMMRIRKVLLSN